MACRRRGRAVMRESAGCATLVAVLMLAGAAQGAEPLALRPGMGGVADPGVTTCALLNEAYEAGPTGLRQMLLYWTEGYVYGKTGLGIDAALATARGGPWTFDTLTDRLVGFCRVNPQASVPEAAADWWRSVQAGG